LVDLTQFVEEYGQAIEQRRATLLVGAGLSRDAGYPSWESLLADFRAELNLPGSFTDLTRLAQYVENERGRDVLITQVRGHRRNNADADGEPQAPG